MSRSKGLLVDSPSAVRPFSDANEEESEFETFEDDLDTDNPRLISDEEIFEDEEEPTVFKRESPPEKLPESVSDSDSEKTQSSPSASAFTIKPIFRRSDFGSPKPKNDSHQSTLDFATVNQTPKRPIENSFHENEPNKKKIKKKVINGEDVEEGKKGSGINRLWSEDDEIFILQGMIDFQLEYNSDPCTDMSRFLEFIKNDLSVDVSKNQLIDKVRRLKKKYWNNSERGINGDDPVFMKQHEQKSFVLSKKIWSNEARRKPRKPRKPSAKASNSVSISSPRVDMEAGKKEGVNVESKVLPEEFLSEYPWLNASFMVENDKFCSEGLMRLVRERMASIGSDKAKELDEKWKKLGENELELYLKKLELVREQCKLILDSMEKP